MNFISIVQLAKTFNLVSYNPLPYAISALSESATRPMLIILYIKYIYSANKMTQS